MKRLSVEHARLLANQAKVLIALFSIGLLVAPVAPPVAAGSLAAATESISVSITQEAIQWQVGPVYDHLVLTLATPNNQVYAIEFVAGVAPALPAVDADGKHLADGTYTYELTVIPIGNAVDAQAVENGRQAAASGNAPVDPLIQSGYFSIVDGAFVLPVQEESSGGDEIRAAEADAPAAPEATNDFVINDDLIVAGSACIGFDCVNGENFSFDTLRLKENNLRIKFQDTSTGSFPSRDWQITANDSASGGANRFSIDDVDGGRTPFTIEAGAPTNSLYVDDGGRVGIGTSTPVLTLHLVSGNSPAVRLEQNGTSGFTPQTWDLAGNEASFFLRDASNGSTLPFRVRPGAPSSSIDIEGVTGDVGFGTTSPEAPIHIRQTDGSARLLVEEAGTTAMKRVLLALVNKGDTYASYLNTAAGVEWQTGTLLNGRFGISILGTGGNELEIHSDGRFQVGPGIVNNLNLAPNGNLTILGSLTVGPGGCSGCVAAAEVINGQSVLSALVRVPVASWVETVVDETFDESGNLVDQREYTVRHMSPVAEQFNAEFNTGVEGNQIAPLDVATVALAGAQELQTEVSQLRSKVSQLEQENANLKSRLAAIEAALGLQGNTDIEEDVAQVGDEPDTIPTYLPSVLLR